MIEIAELIVSGISLLNDLRELHKDLTAWSEADLLVDDEWLALALAKGQLAGILSDYSWSAEARVPTRELKGTHQIVVAHNDLKKIKYRIVKGVGNRLVLTKKLMERRAA